MKNDIKSGPGQPKRSDSNKRKKFTALAVLCLLSGALLTLDNIGVLSGVWRLWPIFPFFLGIGGFVFFKKGKKLDLIALGISSYILLTSILFFILNFTGWSVLAQLWPIFIGGFGVTLLVVACFTTKRRWFIASGVFFAFLSATFFMVFSLDAKLWPISLVLFGIWLLLIPLRSRNE